MAEYFQFLGCPVKVQYRLGDVLLCASGTFVADSGRSIFLEQHVEQRGKRNYFRWEIPYPYIHRIEAVTPPETEAAEEPREPAPPPITAAASAGAGDVAPSSSTVIPFPQRRKTA